MSIFVSHSHSWTQTVLRINSRVNPVERLYAAFPTYLYTNASLGGSLLAPLLESQDDLTGQPYAAQDLGQYPFEA